MEQDMTLITIGDGLLAGARVFSSADRRGDQSVLLVGAAARPAEPAIPRLVLQKGRGHCVVDALAALPDDEITSWAAATGAGADPTRPFEGLGIVVEDAGPDTCLTLIALAMRLAGATLPPVWASYAARWEQGDVATTGAPHASLGALVSALTHGEYDTWQGDAEGFSTRLAQALPNALAYVRATLQAGHDPAALPDQPFTDGATTMLHQRARARLAYEETIYRQHVENGQVLQLSIHLRNTGRKRLADTVLFSETIPTSVLKIFSRTDRDSPAGTGFVMQGLYRAQPGLKGTGADITLSSDISAGLDLGRLWLELERREEDAWARFAAEQGGFPRPRGMADTEDRVLGSHGNFDAAPPPCAEPWYDGGAARTLIGAPRSVSTPQGGEVPASRLSWTDVKEALWRCYAPTFGLRLRRRGQSGGGLRFTNVGAGRALLEKLNTGAGIRIADLERVFEGGDGSALWTDTLRAAMADMIEHGDSSIDTLPDAHDYDCIAERGGIVIVTAHGVAIVDLTRSGTFPSAELRSTANDAALTLATAISLEKTVRDIRSLVQKAIHEGGSQNKRNAFKAIQHAWTKAREVIDESRNHESDGFVRRVRSLCDTRWLSSRRHAAVVKELSELQAQLTAFSDVRAAILLDSIAIFGLPLSLGGNLLGGAILLDATGRGYDGVAWPIIAGYAVFSAAGIALIAIVLYRARRLWKVTE
jgi:hypothetical protein